MTEPESVDLIFSGQLRPGFGEEQVRANLQKLFKANDAQLDRMFSTEPVMLKSRLTVAEAERYLDVLGKAGAACRLRNRPAQQEADQREVVKTNQVQPGVEADEAHGVLGGWNIAPVGSQLGDSHEVPVAAIMSSVNFDLAPVGSDIGDRDEKPSPAAPDVSHLQLSD